MRKVLLLDPADPGVGVCEWERAGEGAEVVAGVKVVGGKADREPG